MITVYHGTDVVSAKEICKIIDVTACAKHTDFGRGFYVTEDFEQAKKWAYRKSRVRGRKPAVVTAYFDVDKAASLIEAFQDDLRWGRFIINNRNGMGYIHQVPFKDNNLDARYPITYGRISDIDVLSIAAKLKESGQMLMSLDGILNTAFPMQYAFHNNEVAEYLVGRRYRNL